ncbi:hypothetical protein [Pseudomonas paeninsulae]|uniref:hypothetical protein n=1 Tax=Pseudomonas paeninsulae TaxID=3110772 RepID=UPI002D76A476|nr:hypothetical protein [Pseudomonas sp. IT1137]
MSAPVWGVPWHGKVQGGVLTLPNAATMPWWQPPADPAHADISGYTFAQRLPGAPEVLRSETELAADTLAGREWRDQFIVGGTYANAAIHGTKAGGWIYPADDGTRWLCTALRDHIFLQGASLSMSFQLRRFGDFAAAPVTVPVSVAITASAMGQLTPGLSGVSSYHATVEDIAADGRSAIVMLYADGVKAWPVGFLLLTLTGSPGTTLAVTLTRLRSRSETLGVATGTNGVAAHSKQETAGRSASVLEDHTGSAPACGYIDDVKESIIYYSGFAQGRLGTDDRGVSARIVAMLFHAGTPTPVTLDVSGSYVTNDAPIKVTAIEGQHIYRRVFAASGGSCFEASAGVVGNASYTEEYHGACIYSRTLTLSYAGASVSFTESREFSRHSTKAWAGQAWGSYGGQWRDDSDVRSGTVSEIRRLEGAPTYTYEISGDIWRSNLVPTMALTFDQYKRPTDTINVFGVVRLSNNILALTAANPYTGEKVIKPLCPAGALPPHATTMSEPTTYSAYNPVTGEAALFADTPVSWT